jgi:signal peptidase I
LPETKEQRSAGSRLKDATVEIVTTVGLAIVLYLVITTFLVQTFRVEQHSMQNTLQPGEHLLIDKITPRFDDYSRGDIIVFHPQGRTDETPYIKRVIGVGGDEVTIAEGQVWVNGQAIDETLYTYPAPGQNEATFPTPLRGQSQWTVPEDQLFVLGDHRQASTDSRRESVGLVDVDDVVGRAWLRFFPLDTLGLLPTPAYPELATG